MACRQQGWPVANILSPTEMACRQQNACRQHLGEIGGKPVANILGVSRGRTIFGFCPGHEEGMTLHTKQLRN